MSNNGLCYPELLFSDVLSTGTGFMVVDDTCCSVTLVSIRSSYKLAVLLSPCSEKPIDFHGCLICTFTSNSSFSSPWLTLEMISSSLTDSTQF